ERDRLAALLVDRGPEAHAAVPFVAVDLLLDPALVLTEVGRVLDSERPDAEPLGLDRELDPQLFVHTETPFVLSAMKGERSQSARGSLSVRPAMRAIRSSSAGQM